MLRFLHRNLFFILSVLFSTSTIVVTFLWPNGAIWAAILYSLAGVTNAMVGVWRANSIGRQPKKSKVDICDVSCSICALAGVVSCCLCIRSILSLTLLITFVAIFILLFMQHGNFSTVIFHFCTCCAVFVWLISLFITLSAIWTVTLGKSALWSMLVLIISSLCLAFIITSILNKITGKIVERLWMKNEFFQH